MKKPTPSDVKNLWEDGKATGESERFFKINEEGSLEHIYKSELEEVLS